MPKITFLDIAVLDFERARRGAKHGQTQFPQFGRRTGEIDAVFAQTPVEFPRPFADHALLDGARGAIEVVDFFRRHHGGVQEPYLSGSQHRRGVALFDHSSDAPGFIGRIFLPIDLVDADDRSGDDRQKVGVDPRLILLGQNIMADLRRDRRQFRR